ncbi:MAG: DNA polymerase III subunit delta [Oscillospiraceae bacterium]|nr:DNA polymerase III subunit delta [Oscillospiraceae bacterium]
MNEKTDRGFERLKADIKSGTPARAYILAGRETYLKDHYLNRLRSLVLEGPMEDFNHKFIDGSDFDLNEFADAVDAAPTFAERTLVEVRDLPIFDLDKDDSAQFIDIISDLPEWLCLVFVYDATEYKSDGRRKALAAAIKENVVTVTINEQGRSELIRWISSHFKAHGKSISRDDCDYLLFLCGSLMSGLNSEIEKIASWCSGDTVTRSDIDAVAIPVLEAAVFDLTDALCERKFAKAADVLGDLLAMQNEPLAILGAIGTNMRRMFAVSVMERNKADMKQIMSLVRTESSFYANKLMASSKRFGQARLSQAIKLCAQADLDLKNYSSSDPDRLSDLLVGLAAIS